MLQDLKVNRNLATVMMESSFNVSQHGASKVLEVTAMIASTEYIESNQLLQVSIYFQKDTQTQTHSTPKREAVMPWKHWKLPAYSWQLLSVLSQRVSKVLLGHSRFSDALIAACAPLKTAYLGERDHAETTHRSKIWQPEMLGRKRSHDGVRRVSGMSLLYDLYVLSSSTHFPCLPRSVPRGRLQLEALDAMRCHAMPWVFADRQSSAEPRTSNTSAFLVEGSTIMRTSSARMNQYVCLLHT